MTTLRPSVWREAWHLSLSSVRAHRRALLLFIVLVGVCGTYPSDLSAYRDPPVASRWQERLGADGPALAPLADWVEHQGRYIATAAQVILPLALGDRVGLVQLVYSGVATTVTTHGLKRAINEVQAGGTRLGERPSGGRHNMPSGHSSMAGSAVGFIWRRYGLWHLSYLLPILLATMATRVFLSAHTVSAVLAGALVGVVLSYVITTPRRPRASSPLAAPGP